MELINASSLLPPQPTTTRSTRNSIAELGSDDFLKLLVAELTHQDPFEPTGNEELLRQISSIREIELSTTLTESLQKLAGQQRFGSASSLIGKFVTGIPAPDGTVERGKVVGIRFNENGPPILLLSNGVELSFDRIGSIDSPQQAGNNLIGLSIVGVDRRDPSNPQQVEGVVTAVRAGEQGEIMLELDSGFDLRLTDVFGVVTTALV